MLPREPAPYLGFLGSDNFFLGPVGKPSGLSSVAIALAMFSVTPCSVFNHSTTTSDLGAVALGFWGSY